MAKAWDDKDAKFITDNIGKYSVGEIAKKLKRSYSSVNNKVRSLGLKRGEKKVVKKKSEKVVKTKSSKSTSELTLDDVKKIGFDAGIVWQYLSENPEQTAKTVLKETKLQMKEFYLAVGWLSREGKIILSNDNKFSVK